jgi:uncharacterized protein (DUF58 family)
LERHGSPRLVAYGTLTVLGLFAAIVTGRAELAALAAPFALIFAAGLVLAETPAVTATLRLDADRVLEGDAVTVALSVASDVPLARVEVVVPVSGDVTIEEPDGGGLAWSGSSRMLVAGVTGRLRAATWGLVRVGPVWVRAHAPLGLVRWEGALAGVVAVRVLPGVATLRTLIRPSEPRAVAGSHVARVRGDGLEFAEVRPYTPGDRLRAVNWAVSARRDGLWVNQRHPERSADLVVLVDTFSDDREGTAPALVRAVRAAWLLATAHLGAHDRVGVVTFGGYPAWLTPGGGERAMLALCDRLLATRAAWTEAQRSVRFLPARVIPSGALVIGLTPLHDLRMVVALADLRRRGLEVAAVEIDVFDEVSSTARDRGLPPAVLRLWRLELERRRSALASVGVPVVAWRADDDAALALDALARARRRPLAGVQ